MITFELLIIISIIGSLTGFLSGVLGIGGGAIVVPAVVYLLNKLYGTINYSQQIALGTSFLIMTFTSLSNIISQNKQKNIDWNIFKKLSLIIVIATFLGSVLAYFISSNILRIFFILFIIILIIKNLLDNKPEKQQESFNIVNIQNKYLIFGGTLIGIISSLVGIGGGIMTIPFLSHFKLDFRKCIGTSAAIGWPIALTGTLTYLITGLNVENLPKYTIGFLHLPSFAMLTIFTITFVPIGVKFSSYISKKMLKTLFLILLLVIAIKMTYSIIT